SNPRSSTPRRERASTQEANAGYPSCFSVPPQSTRWTKSNERVFKPAIERGPTTSPHYRAENFRPRRGAGRLLRGVHARAKSRPEGEFAWRRLKRWQACAAQFGGAGPIRGKGGRHAGGVIVPLGQWRELGRQRRKVQRGSWGGNCGSRFRVGGEGDLYD